jgi:hypothetical protein
MTSNASNGLDGFAFDMCALLEREIVANLRRRNQPIFDMCESALCSGKFWVNVRPVRATSAPCSGNECALFGQDSRLTC